MSKKPAAAASADVDDLLADAAPAKGKAKPKAADAAPAKGKAKGKPAAAPAKATKGKAAPAKAAKGKAKAEASEGGADSPLRKAILKVRKATSYADFAEAGGFNIRTVRRTARALRDAGEIELQKEGTVVYIAPAV